MIKLIFIIVIYSKKLKYLSVDVSFKFCYIKHLTLDMANYEAPDITTLRMLQFVAVARQAALEAMKAQIDLAITDLHNSSRANQLECIRTLTSEPEQSVTIAAYEPNPTLTAGIDKLNAMLAESRTDRLQFMDELDKAYATSTDLRIRATNLCNCKQAAQSEDEVSR